jgi:hypothetical protein
MEGKGGMKFLTQLKAIINTGQSRSVILTGNIYDLFFDGAQWVPLMQLLQNKCKLDRQDGQKGITQICWQVNRPVEVADEKQLDELGRCWVQFHKDTKALTARLGETLDNSVYALELLRQITECARRGNCKNNLLIMIEAADMLLPDAPVSHMMVHDRKRVGIVQDWFGDPSFVSGHDTVILLAESRSAIHQRIDRLPQVLSIEVPLPDMDQRAKFIECYKATTEDGSKIDVQWIAENTSGLSLHAVNQLLRSGDYSPGNLTTKVEEYMEGQLGEGVVEFKRPTHTLQDVIGFRRVKAFIEEELLPGFKDGSIGGALVGGPIGGGKTFICEAAAAESGCPVILLKNIRSKWYGETDQIFERLRRLLETFHKIMIFVDEADAMFGDISSDQETERRLTGKIQAMMSDPALKGRVIWFLMTARVHRLSPDIRRPGRMDLIVPILDPEGEDLEDFAKWAFGDLLVNDKSRSLQSWMAGSSSARFAQIRSRIKAKGCQSVEEARAIIYDMIEPDIGDTRRYQTLQAKINCTRRSLLVPTDVKPEDFNKLRGEWKADIEALERKGVK